MPKHNIYNYISSVVDMQVLLARALYISACNGCNSSVLVELNDQLLCESEDYFIL